MPDSEKAPIRALEIRVRGADRLNELFDEGFQAIIDQGAEMSKLRYPDSKVELLERQLKAMSDCFLLARQLYSAVYPLIDHVPGAPEVDDGSSAEVHRA